MGVIDVEKGADVKAMTPDLLVRHDIPLFTDGAFGFGALLVAHHPKGMMPDEFWRLVKEKSTGKSFFPSFISDRFERTAMARIANAAEKGKMSTTSIGGSLSGVLLASEVLAYLLQGTDLVNRDIIFAPKFAVIDLLKMALEIVDVTTSNTSITKEIEA